MSRLILSILMIIPLRAYAGNDPAYQIRYFSADHIYINAGSADGLNVGDTVSVKRENKTVAELKVVYVSAHSSSCVPLQDDVKLIEGDSIALNRKQPLPEAIDNTRAGVSETPGPAISSETHYKKPSSRLSGRISASYYGWDDKEISNLDFSQPGFRLNMTVNDLWGSAYSLRVRTRTRQNRRVKSYSNNADQSSWLNTVYEFSIGKSDDELSGFRFGRVIPRRISGIGYIDGLVGQKRLSGSLMLGAFAGTQPQWQYASVQSSIQKYGFYLAYKNGDKKNIKLESTAALAAEYHSTTISREFVHLRNSLSKGRAIRLYQSADIDINRGWREGKSGSAVSLSNFYLSGRLGITKRINVGLSFDNRKRYWSYELISLADSLFDDLVRRGAKMSAEIRLPYSYRVSGNVGLRGRENVDDVSKSYSLNLNKTNLALLRINLSLNLAGFSNEYADGFNITYSLGKYFKRGDNLTLNYSIYSYDYTNSNTRRSSRAIAIRGSNLLSRRINAAWEFRQSSGDDIDGLAYFFELGYRLK